MTIPKDETILLTAGKEGKAKYAITTNKLRTMWYIYKIEDTNYIKTEYRSSDIEKLDNLIFSKLIK